MWRPFAVVVLGLLGAAPFVGLGFLIGWEPDGLLHKLALLGLSIAAPATGWRLVYLADKRYRLLG